MTNIFIGGAWPYANGSLHLGRLASLLPGDVLARYFRAKGDQVLYVSGSDCHGTPVAVQAIQEGVAPGILRIGIIGSLWIASNGWVSLTTYIREPIKRFITRWCRSCF